MYLFTTRFLGPLLLFSRVSRWLFASSPKLLYGMEAHRNIPHPWTSTTSQVPQWSHHQDSQLSTMPSRVSLIEGLQNTPDVVRTVTSRRWPFLHVRECIDDVPFHQQQELDHQLSCPAFPQTIWSERVIDGAYSKDALTPETVANRMDMFPANPCRKYPRCRIIGSESRIFRALQLPSRKWLDVSDSWSADLRGM